MDIILQKKDKTIEKYEFNYILSGANRLISLQIGNTYRLTATTNDTKSPHFVVTDIVDGKYGGEVYFGYIV